MATRTVFGRTKVLTNGQRYTFELRKDGLHVRHFHSQKVYWIPNSVLANLAQKEPKLMLQDSYELETSKSGA